MSDHTEEPWRASNHDVGKQIITATHTGHSGTKYGVIVAAGFTREDARRVVACVNALAGVKTEMLEQHGDKLQFLLRGAWRGD